MWDASEGEIGDVFTEAPFRRNGIASKLRELAIELAQENDWHEPAESHIRTEAGAYWAERFGPSMEYKIRPDITAEERSKYRPLAGPPDASEEQV